MFPPSGKAQQAGLSDALRVHEIPQIPRELGDGERGTSPRRFAVPSRIQRDHPEMPGQRGDVRGKVGAVLPVPVQQDQRCAAAGFGESKRDIHGGFLTEWWR